MKMKISAVLVAALFAPAAGAAYKCVDEKGITHIGDTPPAGCANVVMYETNRSGAVLRKIDPTPTAEQLKAREAEYEKMQASLKTEAEKKRADNALLSTYSSEKEFDMTRERNVEPIRGRINAAQERIKQVDKRTKEIEEEMEFYKAGKKKGGSEKTSPERLTAELQRTKTEKELLITSIASYEKEIEATKAKYDADKQRWLALKKPSAKPGDTASATPAADAKAAAKKN